MLIRVNMIRQTVNYKKRPDYKSQWSMKLRYRITLLYWYRYRRFHYKSKFKKIRYQNNGIRYRYQNRYPPQPPPPPVGVISAHLSSMSPGGLALSVWGAQGARWSPAAPRRRPGSRRCSWGARIRRRRRWRRSKPRADPYPLVAYLIENWIQHKHGKARPHA